MKKLFATSVLAMFAPIASAVPVLFTSTSVGVTIASPSSHPDIPAGSAYELVMQMQFDTDALTVESYETGERWETVWAPASVHFTTGGQTFQVDNPSMNYRLGAMFGRDDVSNAPFLNVSISFLGDDGTDYGRAQNGIMLDGLGYSLTHLLDQPTHVTFSAPFPQGAGIFLTGDSGNLVLGPFWMNATTTTISISAVPEPSNVAMLVSGLALLASATAKRRAIRPAG